MREWIGRLLNRKRARLRLCLLYALCVAAVCLALGAPEARETEADAPADDTALQGWVIAVDAGHGGYDGGARGRDSGVVEKTLTLEIARRLEKELTNRGALVVMTRRDDRALGDPTGAGKRRKRADLQARVDIAKSAEADAFLSVHLNDYRDRRESGPQVFFQKGGEAGQALAERLQARLIARLKPARERVAMAGDYYVLRSAIPSALVECGFLSNAAEEKLLRDEAYQQRIAEAVAEGMADYFSQREAEEAE